VEGAARDTKAGPITDRSLEAGALATRLLLSATRRRHHELIGPEVANPSSAPPTPPNRVRLDISAGAHCPIGSARHRGGSELLKSVQKRVHESRVRYLADYASTGDVKANFVQDLNSKPGQALASDMWILKLTRFEDLIFSFSARNLRCSAV
jgi:hypothetical protein